ncbi:MAG: Trm112 family protein [Streptosporangiales bacterium]|nr:Trm112 family protein [Streptosporangiales bacterium]
MSVKLDTWLLEILACPQCRSPLRLEEAAERLVCTDEAGQDCGLSYPIRDGIPVLLIEEASKGSPSGEERA